MPTSSMNHGVDGLCVTASMAIYNGSRLHYCVGVRMTEGLHDGSRVSILTFNICTARPSDQLHCGVA